VAGKRRHTDDERRRSHLGFLTQRWQTPPMAPWMVIVGLIGIGFVVLLVAPTVHRSINARSRASAEQVRVERAHLLRSSPDGASRTFPSFAAAVQVRDRLLLRGVRAEVVQDEGRAALIYAAGESETLESVMRELDID